MYHTESIEEDLQTDLDILHQFASYVIQGYDRLEQLDYILEDSDCSAHDREEIMYYVAQLSPSQFNDVEAYLESVTYAYEQKEKTETKKKQIQHFRRRMIMSV